MPASSSRTIGQQSHPRMRRRCAKVVAVPERVRIRCRSRQKRRDSDRADRPANASTGVDVPVVARWSQGMPPSPRTEVLCRADADVPRSVTTAAALRAPGALGRCTLRRCRRRRPPSRRRDARTPPRRRRAAPGARPAAQPRRQRRRSERGRSRIERGERERHRSTGATRAAVLGCSARQPPARDDAEDSSAPHELETGRALTFDQRVERRDRSCEVQDGLLLVQVELREPPQRIAAKREAFTQRTARRRARAADP